MAQSIKGGAMEDQSGEAKRADGSANDRYADSPSVWTSARASRAHTVVDAGPYYELIREAMLGARQRILLIGWDFDTRVTIGGGRRLWRMLQRDAPPARLGPFMIWLAKRNPNLEIRILKWNFGALKAVFRGRMILDLARWWMNPQIDFKLDSAHPLGCSHHQKIVIIDDKFAACGGIDMTSGRWDTRDHLEADARRKLPGGKLYAPWHDATMLLEGPVARALGDLGRARWVQAGGPPMAPCQPQDETAWPERVNAEFRDVEVGISRTRSHYGAETEVREIEALFVEQIKRAKRFIYAENQYFASRVVAEAMAERMAEPDPPEVFIVTPLSSDGWLQQKAMDTARIQLVSAVKESDHAARFSIWNPHNASDTPIYVHSKLLIVDDEVLRIGSANFNNRSLGLDSECDVFIDALRETGEARDAVVRTITRLRHSLLAEHCGLDVAEVGELIDKSGSMSAMVEALTADRGRVGYKRLRPLPMRELTDTERALADNEVLDPERPEEMLSFYKKGLFGGRGRGGRLLRRLQRRARNGKNRITRRHD
jgi:phosphatidylserine/phosphatidylglycerophosphate/cardiolipin synthase-like enzyme